MFCFQANVEPYPLHMRRSVHCSVEECSCEWELMGDVEFFLSALDGQCCEDRSRQAPVGMLLTHLSLSSQTNLFVHASELCVS